MQYIEARALWTGTSCTNEPKYVYLILISLSSAFQGVIFNVLTAAYSNKAAWMWQYLEKKQKKQWFHFGICEISEAFKLFKYSLSILYQHGNVSLYGTEIRNTGNRDQSRARLQLTRVYYKNSAKGKGWACPRYFIFRCPRQMPGVPVDREGSTRVYRATPLHVVHHQLSFPVPHPTIPLPISPPPLHHLYSITSCLIIFCRLAW